MSLLRKIRLRAGAIVYDWPRLEAALRGIGPGGGAASPWIAMRNRNERITLDGRGARCEWRDTSDLHIAKVFPSAGCRLMRRAFRDWPIDQAETRPLVEDPDVSFVIGHRGLDRLPHLLATLRSVAGQREARIECIVVEQSAVPEIATRLPAWVRHVHTPLPAAGAPYNRSWAFNAGARVARGHVIVFHDNDMMCPARYAAEALERAREGWAFVDLKRFLFYFDEATTRELFETERIPPRGPESVLQNAQGGSIVAARDAFFALGGFDESFIGWGGEDNEFWERAETTKRVYAFGYLPFIHLWHPPQSRKHDPDAPAVRRYHELKTVPPEERIRRLRESV